MAVTFDTYQRVALDDPSGGWEWARGQLRAKPGGTVARNQTVMNLAGVLWRTLLREQFHLRVMGGRLQCGGHTCFVPDLFVVPVEFVRLRRGQPNTLEVYTEPLPLVVEVWSRSTAEYDVDSKLPEYRARGDLEIWRVHPYEKSVTAWRRQPDGTYEERLYTHGAIEPPSMPGLRIELVELFEE